jgi:hypothetical protein
LAHHPRRAFGGDDQAAAGDGGLGQAEAGDDQGHRMIVHQFRELGDFIVETAG